MKLEDQVTNLELSKELKELGVKQESLFYWGYHGDCLMLMPGKDHWLEKDNGNFKTGEGMPYSAFTSSELGEIFEKCFDNFPKEWINDWSIFTTYCRRFTTFRYSAFLTNGKYDPKLIYKNSEDGVTEVDTKAKLLIKALKDKILTL